MAARMSAAEIRAQESRSWRGPLEPPPLPDPTYVRTLVQIARGAGC